MDARTLESLELQSVIGLLVRHVQTPQARRLCGDLAPSPEPEIVKSALQTTTEAVDFLRSGDRFAFGGIEDPGPALARLHIEETALEPAQILALERLLAVASDVRGQFRDPQLRQQYPVLSSLAFRMPDLRRLLDSIRGKILPGGEIDDSASPELRSIRREIAEARNRVFRVLESLLRSQPQAVQDDVVTFRNGRFVIPIRTDSRSQVPGVVHGLSSSGQTTFVEPLHVIDQNNAIVRLREQEELEIARILRSITEALRDNLPGIRVTADTIGELDFAQAKGRLSIEFNCVCPVVSVDRKLVLGDARHVLLEQSLRAAGSRPVPISLSLDEDRRVLVVSGPNAGGKTVVLKCVGLAALMSQMGLHVPAREAILPVFSQIYADIGDQQSIAANLSTFTAHMRNIADMASKVTPSSLLLLDEVGTGTDPDEGAALAVAIVSFFLASGSTAIATTHYPALKIWASRTPGVRNASVEFDERTLRPTYQLIQDIAGASSGLEIARRMQVPEPILEDALRRIDPGHAEARDYLRRLKASLDEQLVLKTALEKERHELTRESRRLETAFDERELRRRKEVDQALQRIESEFRAESERLVATIKDRAEAARTRRTAAKGGAELRKAADRLRLESSVGPAPHPASAPGEKSQPPAPRTVPAEIREGDRVAITPLGKEGVVASIQAEEYSVQVGVLRFRARRDELRPVLTAQPAEPAKRALAPVSDMRGADIDGTIVTELNIIGLTSDDATDRVMRFLDQAVFAGAEHVRIIHGFGKGILRRAVAELLASHPEVLEFKFADPRRGGGGATEVHLRK